MAEFLLTTPSGKGAIAVLTLYAEEPTRIVSAFFTTKSGKRLDSFRPGDIVYGTIFEEDALICLIQENELEIHCHGSLAAVERLKNFLRSAGATECSRETWISRNFPQQTENQRRAFAALLKAETEKTAAILWDQVQGAFEKALENGEDTERWKEVATHLTRPWKAVMVGEPNVGKSSLFNAILGFPRAIVFEQAGTTRDILREKTILDGWPVELADTAGLHETGDRIEIEGIRRARLEIESADLILWIRDATERGRLAKAPELPTNKKTLVVWNKADLIPDAIRQETFENELAVSALNGDGIDELLKKMIQTLVPEEPPRGTGMKILRVD